MNGKDIGMVLGLGHDVVDVTAFEAQLAEPGSRMRGLFSARELRQAAARARVKNDGEAVHLAAKWAGKESVLKAWCDALSGREADTGQPYPYAIDDFPWREIEILDDSRGVPHVVLSGRVSQALRESIPGGAGGADDPAAATVCRWHVSLTHDGPIASAVVLLEPAA